MTETQIKWVNQQKGLGSAAYQQSMAHDDILLHFVIGKEHVNFRVCQHDKYANLRTTTMDAACSNVLNSRMSATGGTSLSMQGSG